MFAAQKEQPPSAPAKAEKGNVALALAALGGAAVWGAVGGLVKEALGGGKKKRTKVLGVIPARYKSSRFPGKPLTPILGKPMIQRTYEQAKQAHKLDKLVVATDDERIAECVRNFGGDVVMTSESCPNGTERCDEACNAVAGQGLSGRCRLLPPGR